MKTCFDSVCRLCGGRELAFLFECKGVNLIRCGQCGYVQITSEPTREEIAAIYDEAYFSSSKYNDRSILERENRRRTGLMKKFLHASDATVLEVGCATGDFLASAKQMYRVCGCDVSEFAVAKARISNPDIADRIWVGNPGETEQCPGGFDAICLWDVIEHLWDPVGVCSRLALMLKPEGCFFFSSPDIGSFTAKILGRQWPFMTPPEHMGFFSAESFSHLFRRVKPFHIEYLKSNGKWTNLGFIVHKLKRMFPSLIPSTMAIKLQNGAASKLPLYVPTLDIQYVVARKVEGSR